MAVTIDTLFRDAMTHLASGVAVITARRRDGYPCGIAATSLTSYSAHPPSLLVSVWHGSRCHPALAACEHFGVHLLRSDELALAERFANRSLADKFEGIDWRWDDDVPELGGTLAYLRCRRAENFVRYDHTVLVGDLDGGRVGRASRSSTRGGAWTGSCSRWTSKARSHRLLAGRRHGHPDHLQPPRQRAVGELGLLLRGVAEELVLVAEGSSPSAPARRPPAAAGR